MCGIGGIISLGDASGLPSRLEAMSRRLRHRGPDDEGFALIGPDRQARVYSGERTVPALRQQLPPLAAALNSNPRIGLCHQRFAIIDPTVAGHQPWYDEQAELLLVFNGEIYNYVELRKELQATGHGPFVSESDTEVVVAAYRAWGVSCFERFNGFWALAFVDLSNWQVIISRDRFGKKPLYLYRDKHAIAFASEIRAIFAASGRDPGSFHVDRDAAALYLLYDRRNTLRDCMWEEIDMLPPASFSIIDLKTGREKVQTYWNLNSVRRSESELPLSRAIEEFSGHLSDAVNIRLRADVPIAANLSGGMDSSSIVAHAQNSLGPDRKLETNIIHYRDAPELDERVFATAVAEKVGSNHTELEISSEQTWEHMAELIEAFEEPVHSAAFMTQWLGWKAIRDQGTKVILHGAAADEMFAGYTYHSQLEDFASLNSLNLRQYFRGCPIWNIRAQLRAARSFGRGWVWPAVSNPLRKLAGLPDRRRFNRDYDPGLFQRWFDPGFVEDAGKVLGTFNRRFLEADQNLASRMEADVNWLRVPFWVNAMDKSMMQIPVEVRMPYLDHRLVEYVFSLPVSYLYRDGWTKYILRRSMQGLLPDSVVWRKQKMGFTVPKERWLRQHKEMLTASLTDNNESLKAFINVDRMHDDLSSVPTDILWRSANFAKWLEIFRPMT
jgi:asparagine synthase (glutamine-hydrolysing)